MPQLVTELTTLNSIQPDQQVIIFDPATEVLHVTDSENFRGAGIFQGNGTPPASPLVITGFSSWIEGDLWIDEDDNNQLYSWDSTNTTWVSGTRLSASEVHDAATITGALTSNFVEFTHANLKAGDYIDNHVRGLRYGPYNAVTGVDLSIESTMSYHIRSSTSFAFEISSPDEYFTALNVLLGDIQNPAHKPKEGDTFSYSKTLDEGHGGWVERFSQVLFDASTNPARMGKIQEGLEPRVYARSPQVWSEVLQPVQNDFKYRQGDIVYDNTNSVLYSGYKENVDPVSVIDLLDIFDTKQSLLGAVMHYSDAEPVIDDGLYTTGEFLIVDSHNTSRLYGPYLEGETDVALSWTLRSYLRAPREILIPVTTEEAPLTVLTDFITATDYYPLVGDKWGVYYSDSKTKLFTLETFVGETLTWSTTYVAKHRVGLITTEETTPFPAQDDTIYYEGTLLALSSGVIFGPYVEDALSISHAWPIYLYLRGGETHTIAPHDLTPLPTALHDPVFVGIRIKEGDYVQHEIIGSTTGLLRKYGPATVDETTGTIGWPLVPVNVRPTITHYHNDTTHPSTNDLNYQRGDLIYNQEGFMYGPYVLEGVLDSDSWPDNIDLKPSNVLVDEGLDPEFTGVKYKLVVVDGALYKEEIA